MSIGRASSSGAVGGTVTAAFGEDLNMIKIISYNAMAFSNGKLKMLCRLNVGGYNIL